MDAVDSEDLGPLFTVARYGAENADEDLCVSLEDLSILATPESSSVATTTAGGVSTAVMEIEEGQKKEDTVRPSADSRVKMSGAAKKRYKRLVEQGMARGRETKILALRPLKETSAPKVSKASKRVRSGDQSPPAQTSKKPRGEGVVSAEASDPVSSGVTFRQAVESEVVGILSVKFPEEILSVEQLSTVQENILELVLKQENQELKPRFLGSKFCFGWLMVTCANKSTAQWLREVVEQLKPWEGAELKAVEANNLPRAKIVLGSFPNSAKISSEKVLGFIKSQNEGMTASKWRVIGREDRGSSALCTLSVDHMCAEKLKLAKYKINYMFGQVQLHPKGRGKPGGKGRGSAFKKAGKAANRTTGGETEGVSQPANFGSMDAACGRSVETGPKQPANLNKKGAKEYSRFKKNKRQVAGEVGKWKTVGESEPSAPDQPAAATPNLITMETAGAKEEKETEGVGQPSNFILPAAVQASNGRDQHQPSTSKQ